MKKVEYSTNNSGGSWWLTDQNWHDLEAAGWDVDWVRDLDDEWFEADADGRWLGALAKTAHREGLPMGDAIAEWERVTGCASNDLGCSCCGPPHSFIETDDDGNRNYWSPDYPSQGEAYA